MDRELLSLFPSETDRPVEREQAAAMHSSNGTDPRLRAASDTIQVLEHHVHFLKARSHVAHALTEDDGNTNVVHAVEGLTSSEREVGGVGLTARRGLVAAVTVAVIVLAFAGASLLPADHTPANQEELLATMEPPALKIAEPAIAPRMPRVEVAARKAQISSGTADAQKTSFTGHLVVDSVPPGATVLINQRPAGTTPLLVRDYRAGSYALWVEREGYERWTAGVLVPANKTTHITATLSKAKSLTWQD
jgi:hypothetical protein